MTTPDDTTFENEVRAMLRRRADDITLDTESDLALTAVTTTPGPQGRILRRTRLAMLAAACLLVVTCLGAVIANAGEGDAQRVLADQSETTEIDEPPTSAEEASTAPTSADEATSTTEAPGTTEAAEPPGEGPAEPGPTEPPATDPTPPATSPGPEPAPSPSTISFNQGQGSGPGQRWSHRLCNGTYRPTTYVDAIIRIDRSGPTDHPITIGLAVSGSLAAHVEMEPSVTIPAGESTRLVTVPIGGVAAGSVTITAQPGAAYVLGSPTTETFTLPSAEESTAATDCLRPIHASPATLTTTVGDDPADVTFLPRNPQDTHPVVDGALPPGLRLEVLRTTGNKDVVRWSGAATTPGTYQVTIRHCRRDDLTFLGMCDGTSKLTIIVQEP